MPGLRPSLSGSPARSACWPAEASRHIGLTSVPRAIPVTVNVAVPAAWVDGVVNQRVLPVRASGTTTDPRSRARLAGANSRSARTPARDRRAPRRVHPTLNYPSPDTPTTVSIRPHRRTDWRVRGRDQLRPVGSSPACTHTYISKWQGPWLRIDCETPTATHGCETPSGMGPLNTCRPNRRVPIQRSRSVLSLRIRVGIGPRYGLAMSRQSKAVAATSG